MRFTFYSPRRLEVEINARIRRESFVRPDVPTWGLENTGISTMAPCLRQRGKRSEMGGRFTPG